MSVWIKRPDQSGLSCECQPTPCEPCVPAPCDLFIPDDTLYGELTYGAPASGVLSWAGLGVGFYSFVAIVLPPPGPTFTPTWSSTDYSGTLDYADPRGPFIGQSVLTDTVDLHYPGFPYDPLPTFDLMRYRKLARAQPTKLGIILDTFADGRWRAIYDGAETTRLSFTATAAEVQDALNALLAISAFGGVAVTGDSALGYTVTWNYDGPRFLLDAHITTANPGMLVTTELVQEGVTLGPGEPPDPLGLSEIQKIAIKRSCADCNADTDSAEWDGTMNFVRFGYASWRFSESDITDYLDLPSVTNNLQLNGSQFAEAWIYLDQLSSGDVDSGAHRWRVTFVTVDGESTAGPTGGATYGPAAVQVPLTIPLGPAGTTARRIYRTLAAGSTYHYLDELSDNVTTAYTDDTSDADLAVGAAPPSESDVPPPTEAPVPSRCQWRLLLFCFTTIFGSLHARLFWSGRKPSGATPEGTYVWANYSAIIGGTACDLDQSQGVRTLEVVGLDFVS